MSHAATNWAIQQRGLKPATKIVLWHLCDCYNPSQPVPCFPGQDYLAENCEMSRSSLNDHLDALEKAGLIAREQRRQKGSMKQDRTRYRFAFEPGFAPVADEDPSPDFGHGSDAEAVSENGREPCPKNDESRVRNSDSNPVREPVKEPVIEREGASEPDEEGEGKAEPQAQNRKAIEAAYWALVMQWPQFKGMPKQAGLPHWMKLTPEERERATQRFPAWLALLKAQNKDHVPAPSTYFSNRLFDEVDEVPKPVGGPETVAPFGKAGMAMRIWIMHQPERPHTAPPPMVQRTIDAGGPAADDEIIKRRARMSWPRLADMDDRILDHPPKPIRVPPGIAALGSEFVSVELAGPVGQAWKRMFRKCRLPFLPMEPRYVYLPPIAAGAEDIERAVADAFWQFAERCKDHADAA